MEDLEALAAHRHVIERLIPLLEAIRSVAEIAWRRADQGYRPLMRYGAALRAALEQTIATLEPAQRQALLGSWTDGRPIGLLFVASERGLCGAFNKHLVTHGLQHLRTLAATGATIRLLCLGSRGRRLLEAAGHTMLYYKPMPSLSVPTYLDIENIALDLLDLAEQGAFGLLMVVYNTPVRRFQFGVSIRTLLPPDITVPKRPQQRLQVKPAGDAPVLMTHLLTEYLLVELYRAVRESVISEQLARVQAMRLAGENARKLLDELTLEYHLAQSHAVTNALLEIIAGYEATAHR
jgi:F-type H+-transporting ATPase subunit gamma